MHLEVLTEDKSGGVVLNSLLQNILDEHQFPHTFAIRPHRGKGFYPANPLIKPARFASGLLDLLPAKIRAYAATGQPDQLLLIIVMDSDANDPQTVKDSLVQMVQTFGNGLPAVIGIAVEEAESWILGDKDAILAAYPNADLHAMDAYHQDSVCGTWEVLAHVLAGKKADHIIKIGYPAIGQIKNEWARNIAPHLDPRRNKSPSFQLFYHALLRSLLRKERFNVRRTI